KSLLGRAIGGRPILPLGPTRRSRCLVGRNVSPYASQSAPLPFFPEFHTPRGVHVEQTNRRATCRRQPKNLSPSNNKVIGPDVSARAEQCHHGPRVRIGFGPLYALQRTGQRQAAGIVRAAVLS